MSKKNILAPLAALTLLASCGSAGSSKSSKTEPVDLAKVFSAYRGGITATGTTEVYYDEEVHSTANFVTKFTATSYHFEEEVDGQKSASADLFQITKDGEKYVATSDVNADNEVVMTPSRDEEGGLIGWSTVQNPFLDSVLDPGFFDYREEGYYTLDFSKDAEKRGNRYQAAVDLISKFALITPYGFDSVKVYLSGEKIQSIAIITKAFSLSKPKVKAHYEVNIALDNDPAHDHNATMATPFAHEDYHDALKQGFDALLNNPSYSFTRDASTLASVQMPHLKGYVSEDAFYYALPSDDSQFSALIKKDNKVYEVVKDGEGYAYEETPLTDDEDSLLRAIPAGYYPQRAEPVEAFSYEADSKKYVLDKTNTAGVSLADYFAFYFDSFGYGREEESMASNTFTRVEVSLCEGNKISTIALQTESKGNVVYTFAYDKSALPFDPASLTAKDVAASAYGTYTGTFANDAALHAGESYTITFKRVVNTDEYTKEKHPYNYVVSLSYGTDSSVYTAINVSYSPESGLHFESGGESYSLSKKEDGTYLLQVSDDSGATASCAMAKQAA